MVFFSGGLAYLADTTREASDLGASAGKAAAIGGKWKVGGLSNGRIQMGSGSEVDGLPDGATNGAADGATKGAADRATNGAVNGAIPCSSCCVTGRGKPLWGCPNWIRFLDAGEEANVSVVPRS